MPKDSLLQTMGIARGSDRVIAQLPKVDPHTPIELFNPHRYTVVSYIEEGTEDA